MLGNFREYIEYFITWKSFHFDISQKALLEHIRVCVDSDVSSMQVYRKVLKMPAHIFLIYI